ncbi:acetyltransferase (GNAT) family protein [Variovorax sp. 54]|uniref:GNAT family N-acetyltransferase n=1 Tax=Variovorax sp. 54 TaxID=2035212 RepID=UPI000C435830|nr:GNAT family N-acetyltransferase [Variovorax sp. 54]PIF73494.1 acetyltransferase (GNAT) family protein [Variovorax sp. 54]
MNPTLRAALDSDVEFAFDAKRQALGPYVAARWGWDDDFQRNLHLSRWQERPWSIILKGATPVGTIATWEVDGHRRIGEFYVLPAFQRAGIGSAVLRHVLEQADRDNQAVRLEHLKWNPVGELYARHGFVHESANDTHCFLVRWPVAPSR